MSFLEIIFFSFLQGLTEFLPVSSSGHLFLAEYFLDLTNTFHFNVAVHLGTVLAILTFYRSFIQKIIKDVFFSIYSMRLTSSFYLVYCLFLSCIPTAIIGYLLTDFVKSFSHKPLWLCGGFFLTGGFLMMTRFLKPNQNLFSEKKLLDLDISSLTPFKALCIGVVQGIAVIPGFSRSGWTIATGLFLGLPPKTASFYSFILSVPAILGASFLTFKDFNLDEKISMDVISSILSSYFFSLIGLVSVIYFVKKNKLSYFSYYLFILCFVIFSILIY